MQKKLISEYNKKKDKIKNRLKEFKRIKDNRNVFSELCFCILTPQSKAVYCDKAICFLKKSNLLFKGNKQAIAKKLKGFARFHNKKGEYLVGARTLFTNGKDLNIKYKLDPLDTLKTRQWLVKNVKGLGYKEASHFLRNIGLGENMAILDVHILRSLKKLGVIEEIPGSITKKKYIDIENRMRGFSDKLNIPLGELDLLFWSNETGFVFK